jgi:hypothetical protein
VDVPGFGEPRKSACFVFSLCLLSVQYAQQEQLRKGSAKDIYSSSIFSAHARFFDEFSNAVSLNPDNHVVGRGRKVFAPLTEVGREVSRI